MEIESGTIVELLGMNHDKITLSVEGIVLLSPSRKMGIPSSTTVTIGRGGGGGGGGGRRCSGGSRWRRRGGRRRRRGGGSARCRRGGGGRRWAITAALLLGDITASTIADIGTGSLPHFPVCLLLFTIVGPPIDIIHVFTRTGSSCTMVPDDVIVMDGAPRSPVGTAVAVFFHVVLDTVSTFFGSSPSIIINGDTDPWIRHRASTMADGDTVRARFGRLSAVAAHAGLLFTGSSDEIGGVRLFLTFLQLKITSKSFIVLVSTNADSRPVTMRIIWRVVGILRSVSFVPRHVAGTPLREHAWRVLSSKDWGGEGSRGNDRRERKLHGCYCFVI
mmetsp:Transcript_11845/g.22789  ORF Transcript_11845/g.22789 Transcript_11845/m.22789 type:complete len:332 (+) Transcript_11845:762-1757(+)